MAKEKISVFFEGKEFSNEQKSEEEIKRYMLDDGLGELNRVKKILKSGDTIQKQAIYGNMHSYFAWDHTDSAAIFEAMIGELQKQDEETQVESARGLRILFQDENCMKEMKDKVKQSVFEVTMSMMGQKSVNLINEWILVFEAFLRSGNFTTYEKAINDEFFKLSGITSSSINKATSMRILGILMQVKEGKVSEEMIEIAKLFSQTAEVEIKQRLLNYVVESIFKYLPVEVLEKFWNEKLVEFLQDQNIQIKCECIAIVAKILPNLSDSFKASKIKVLFFDLLNTKQSQVRLTFSQYIGPFIFYLHSVLDQKAGNQSAIFATLQEYCESTDSRYRINYLFNLPGVLAVYGKKLWTIVGKQYFVMLLKDENIDVRVQAASIYGKVIEFLGKQDSRNLVRQHVHAIFLEESSGPKNALMKVLPEIIQLFSTSETKLSRPFFSELLRELVEALESQMTSANWRFLLGIIKLVTDNFSLFDSSELAEVFAPALFQALMKANKEVRQESLNSILELLRQLSGSKPERETILAYISNNTYMARSFHQKDILLSFSEALLDDFDPIFLKDFKLINVLGCSLDKVSTIRYHLANMLILIYYSFTLTADKELFNKLIEITKNLIDDKDTEIARIANEAFAAICQQNASFQDKVMSYQPPNTSDPKSINHSGDQYDDDYLLKKVSEKQGLNKQNSNPMQRKSTTISSLTQQRNSIDSKVIQKSIQQLSTKVNNAPSNISPQKKLTNLPVQPPLKKLSLQEPVGFPKKQETGKITGTLQLQKRNSTGVTTQQQNSAALAPQILQKSVFSGAQASKNTDKAPGLQALSITKSFSTKK